MLNLIKYDWMKRWKLFIAGLLMFVLTDIDIVTRIMSKSNPTKMSVIFIGVLFALFLALVFDQIGRLYKSLYTEEGCLLFTLPISGYRLLASKMIAVIIECLGVITFISFVSYIDYKILVNMIPKMEVALSSTIIIEGLKGIALLLLSYIVFLLIVYLSMVLSKSIFAPIKHGKIMAFIFFLIISEVISKIANWLNFVYDFVYDIGHLNKGIYFGGNWAFIIVLIALLFGVTGYLMDRKINL